MGTFFFVFYYYGDMATINCANYLGKSRATFKTINLILDFLSILGNEINLGGRILTMTSHNCFTIPQTLVFPTPNRFAIIL